MTSRRPRGSKKQIRVLCSKPWHDAFIRKMHRWLVSVVFLSFFPREKTAERQKLRCQYFGLRTSVNCAHFRGLDVSGPLSGGGPVVDHCLWVHLGQATDHCLGSRSVFVGTQLAGHPGFVRDSRRGSLNPLMFQPPGKNIFRSSFVS